MRRIVKIGGSLLTRRDLVSSMKRWHAAQSSAQTLLVVGGGELIDAIRRLDRIRPDDPASVHWRCVDLLQNTFEIACQWFPDWNKIDTPSDLERAIKRTSESDIPSLVSVRSFYHRNAGFELPLTWETTSDAIAGLLAIQFEADELVLLKSCDVDPSTDLDAAARSGVIDSALPVFASRIGAIRLEKLAAD